MPRLDRPRPLAPWILVLAAAIACSGDSGGGDDGATGMITSASAGSTGAGSTGAGSTSATATSGVSESDGGSGPGTTSVSTSDPSSTSEDPSTSTSGATTGATTGDTSDSEATGGAVEPCQVESTAIQPIPSDILFVLDKSGSMSMELWDHDKDLKTPMITRWKSLHSVVEAVVTKFDDKLHFGAKLYPKIDAGSYYNQGACEVTPGVEVPVAPKNAAAILAVVPGPDVMVLGGTPSYKGLKEGYTYLKGLKDGLARAVIFITDGEISCDDPPAAAIAAISDALAKDKTPTYVVGVDVDDQTAAQLDLFAVAGGKPVMNGQYSFYQTLDQLDLEAAMQKILDDTIGCVLPIDPAPDQPDLFEVWLNGAEIPRIDACAGESGWLWSAEFSEITLCGDACAALKKGGDVEAKYFCVAG